MGILTHFINLILPPRCIYCGTILNEHNGLCADCFNKITFIGKPMCHCCGIPFDADKNIPFGTTLYCASCLKKKKHLFKMIRSSFIYNDESKKLILDFKFRDKTSSAAVLADFLYAAGADIWKEKPDLLLPVPLHRLRLIKRRYNQSALLVKNLSLKTGIEADYFSLLRTQNTIPQVELSGLARRHNLQSAFKVKNVEKIQNKNIVLVDDVTTTGATLNECAKVLKNVGAGNIYALTLARTRE